LKAIPSLLRSILPEALEFDVLTILTSSPAIQPGNNCLAVLQESSVESPAFSQLVSRKGKVVAVVDRTADLASAAEQLVAARFAFGGTSPYAPDLVLVNEWVKKDFVALVLRQAIRFIAASGQANGSTSKKGSSIDGSLHSLQDSKRWKLSTITTGDNGALVELISTSAKLLPLPPKISEPIFCISTITSLDHAVDLVSTSLSDTKLLAGYHFAAPTHAKYLAQFCQADASFINQVPLPLLLGPAAPGFQSFNLEARYIPSHFERASPQFIKSPASQIVFANALSGDKAKAAASKLLEQSLQEIKAPKRPESIAIGFFEQGIFIGLGFYGIPIITCLGASIYFLSKAAFRRFG
jgi:aldehyde dehydrogenase (NAD+)